MSEAAAESVGPPHPASAEQRDNPESVRAARGRSVLEGAFMLLDALSRCEAAGLSQLGRATDLPKATTYRLLDQLTRLGAVDHDRLGGYRIGAELHRLADRARPFRWMSRAAQASCTSLASTTGTTVGLTVLQENRLIGVYGVTPPHGLGVFTPGTVFPLSAASGQVLFAEQPELGPPPAFSDGEWRRIRASIRHHGVAFDQQDVTAGVCCVAAPVRASDGRVVASLAALTIADSIPRGLADLVRQAAAETGRRLG